MASEIEKTCNKVAIMYDGELLEQSATEHALRTNPTIEDYFLSVVKDKRGELVI
jgi:ABC-type dipeptide/oligopeptide/nickel transport system ATPase component